MASKLPRNFTVIKGDFDGLPVKVQDYVADKIKLCKPDNLYICDGSKEENEELLKLLMDAGIATPLFKHDNWWVNAHMDEKYEDLSVSYFTPCGFQW